jgi:NAD(P)-dependent dehydrogenase (short-subunit alcohol dehydrogenase family)
VLAVNLTGPWLVMRAWARYYAEQQLAASMVATSSVSARLVDRSMGAYCTSKAGLSMTVRIAAAEWAPAIRVNAVAPGVTATPMLGGAPVGQGWLGNVADRTALGRLGSADDIADAVFALHALPWVTGQVLEADGGLSLHSPINAWGEARAPQ